MLDKFLMIIMLCKLKGGNQMYVPKEFKETHLNQLIAEMKKNSFGILLSNNEEAKIEATHLPFIIQEAKENLMIITHLAKPNPQWKTMNEKRMFNHLSRATCIRFCFMV